MLRLRREKCFLAIAGAMLTAALLPARSYAHALHLHTSVIGVAIEGRVYYAGDAPAIGASVRIEGLSGDVVEELKTDENGRFRFVVPYRADYRVVAESEDLHRAEATIRSSAFPEKLAPAEVDPEIQRIVKQAETEQLEGVENPELRKVLERLDQMEKSIGLRDMIGGIGFILGVLAIVYFLKRRLT